MSPEQKARVNIDAPLQQAGWQVCDLAHANIHAARGVALREFPLNPGHGFADYLLYLDGKAAGVIEAKQEGSTLTGVNMPKMDMKNMPEVPIEFSSSGASAGLELVDLHLWIFKRFMENKELAPELFMRIKPHLNRGRTDEISLAAIGNRWTKYFEQLPELHEMSVEQVARGKEMMRIDEERRLKMIDGVWPSGSGIARE